ncbi:MAG: hypothetical protein KAH04_06125 [Psychrilyobacter sp.]|nr:hypothetical protein [Psychrilyobacter sp.]
MKQDMKTVNDIIKIIGESQITEIAIEEKEFKLFIKKPKLAVSNVVVNTEEIVGENTEEIEINNIEEIVSETVGKFYYIDKNEKKIISEGMEVKEGQKIGYIKAIGLKTDIISHTNGIIKEIISKNGDIAEYGKVLVKIEKS